MPMRSAIGLDDLRSFYLVAEAGGVSAASRQFGVSKATLSRALTRLEAQAGAQLFDRVSTGVRLTPAGETLIDAAHQATEAGSARAARASVEVHQKWCGRKRFVMCDPQENAIANDYLLYR